MAEPYEGVIDELLADPETRRETLALVKRKRPNDVVPEFDLEDRLSKQSQADREKIEARQAKIEEEMRADRLQREADRQWAGLVGEGLVADSERADVEKLVEEGAGTLRFAALAYSAQRKPAESAAETYQRGALEGSNLDDFLKNPDGTADKIAHEMVDAMNRGRFAG